MKTFMSIGKFFFGYLKANLKYMLPRPRVNQICGKIHIEKVEIKAKFKKVLWALSQTFLFKLIACQVKFNVSE